MLDNPERAEAPVSDEGEEQGWRFVLPRRKRTWPAALFLIPFGLVFAGGPAAMAVGAIASVAKGEGALGLIMVPFALPFLVIGLGVMLLGIACLHSALTVEVTPDELRAIERVGPIRWTFRRRLRALRSVALAEKPVRGTRGRTAELPGAGESLAVRAEFEGARTMWLAAGYPRPLQERLLAALQAAADDQAGLQVEVAAEPPAAEREKARDRHTPARPADTDIDLAPLANGILVSVPPAGFWRGSKGLGFIGIAFLGFVALFGGFSVVMPLMKGQAVADAVPFLLFSLLFGGIGLAMLLAGLNMGRRSATLEVDGQLLVVRRRTLRGEREWEWSRDELDDVRRGGTGMAVNDVPVLELQIHARGQKALGLLSQRSDEEIAWIAAELRERLRL